MTDVSCALGPLHDDDDDDDDEEGGGGEEEKQPEKEKEDGKYMWRGCRTENSRFGIHTVARSSKIATFQFYNVRRTCGC